jgi:hypothetical protein
VKIADGIVLELPLVRPIAVDLRQSADAVALQTAVQRRSDEVFRLAPGEI